MTNYTKTQINAAKQHLNANDVPGFDRSAGEATKDDAIQLLDSGWKPGTHRVEYTVETSRSVTRKVLEGTDRAALEAKVERADGCNVVWSYAAQ